MHVWIDLDVLLAVLQLWAQWRQKVKGQGHGHTKWSKKGQGITTASRRVLTNFHFSSDTHYRPVKPWLQVKWNYLEIIFELFWNNFEIILISVFYFTCNHAWNWNKIISAVERVLKLFQNYFSEIERVRKYSRYVK